MTPEKATIYRAEKLENLLVFQAHYRNFAFDRHTHEDFALGLMEEGVQTFHCRGEDFYAPPGSMLTVNPDEIHDGKSADKSDFRYRIIYIPYDLLQRVGAEMLACRRNNYFCLPVTVDGALASELGRLFQLLEEGGSEPLELQVLFSGLLSRLLVKHGTERGLSFTAGPAPHSISKVCDFINEMAAENISLEEMAAIAGLSKYHFLHLFSAVHGISPYAMLLNRRLQLARDALRKGMSIVDAALAAGFSDQSHLSRRFKSAFGITPGQYRKALQ